MIEKVVVSTERVELHLKDEEEPLILPVKVHRRSGRTRLLKQDEPEIDALLFAVAKGCKWLEELESGTVDSMHELAEKHDVEEAWMRKHLRLALLPPEEIEGILAKVDVSVSELFGRDIGVW